MMLLSMISMMELLVLIVAGWLILRLVKPRHGQRSGGGLKFLGIAAIVAGIAVFWIHPRRHVHVDYTSPAPATVIHDDHFGGLPESVTESIAQPVRYTVREEGPPRWVFISLGAGLVILGALLFGRGRERPVALKAVTLLGVGAILYAVVTFLGQAPRRNASTEPATVVRLDHRDRHPVATREYKPTHRHRHAKRPTRRPERPFTDAPQEIDELPQRAGGIPVSVELDRQASKAAKSEPKEPAPPKPAAEPTPAPPAVPAVEPAPATPPETATEEPESESSEPAAGAAAVEVPAEPEPETAVVETEETEEEQAPEPREPAEAAPAAEPSKPTSQFAKVEAAKPKPAETAPVETEAEVTESIDEVVASTEPRPDWVDALPVLDHGVYSLPVRSGRFVTLPECQRALDDQIKEEADHYINEYLGDDQAAGLVNIPISYLKEHVKKKEYVETVQPKELQGFVGHMYEIHALLEFDDRARSDFRRQWHNAEVANRLWYTGGAAALVLALLATLYGYLKLDLRTGGAHKGRLQLAATLVALIAAAGVLLVRWAVHF